MSDTTTYDIKLGTPETLLQYDTFNVEDTSLIEKVDISTTFDQKVDRIDVLFYSLDSRLLKYQRDVKTYRVIGGPNRLESISNIELNVREDVLNAGYSYGDVNVMYNFVKNLYNTGTVDPKFFIESISTDRTELRLLSNELSSLDIQNFTEAIKSRINESSFFQEFRVDFGNGVFPIGVNIDSLEYRGDRAVVVKLYEPLSSNIQVKSTLEIEEFVSDSVLYQVTATTIPDTPSTTIKLKGPNFSISSIDSYDENTELLSYNELFDYPITSSAYELFSTVNTLGANISIDYTDFSQFINMSSAEERLKNFYYKASLLENYQNQLDTNGTYSGSLKNNIENIVTSFDHYDRYLYYETGSWSWPKSTSTKPYELQSTGSLEVTNWYNSIILSASNYDNQNLDRLISSIPSFIREDTSNSSYLLFVDMIAQHFDNIWIYTKALTEKYNNDNRLNFGVSRDLVKDVVKNFGIKIYDTNRSFDNLFKAFIGETFDTGSELSVNTIISASVGDAQPISTQQYQQEIYKRVYHNLPLLLKSKGTERGLRTLVNIFGIPPDTLKIKTFGGQSLNDTVFYGGDRIYSSSLDKIKIADNVSVVTGSTLSNNVSVVNQVETYSKDLSILEIGFSPTDDVNDYLITHPSMSNFDIDDYIGDPRTAYLDEYTDLNIKADEVYISGSSYLDPYDIKEFIRIIKFFDNSIFKTVKEFVPARATLNTGIVIKPHILNRNKVKQVEVKWSNQLFPDRIHANTDLDYTGSQYDTNFYYDSTVEVGSIEGSDPLKTEFTSSYVSLFPLPDGGYAEDTSNNANQALFTGEFSGSKITTTTGELNKDNPFKKIVSGSYSNLFTEDLFNTDTSPGIDDKFKFNDYAPLSNNVHSVRRSNKFLSIDPFPSASTNLPRNYSSISTSISSNFSDTDPKLFAEVQDSNYSSKAWSNIRYEGSENRENINSVFEGSKGNLPFVFLKETEGVVFDIGTSNNVIADIVTTEGRASTKLFFYTLTRPDSGSNFRQLNTNNNILTPELFFENSIDSGSKAKTFLTEIEGNRLVKVSNKRVFLRELNTVETTDINGKILRRDFDPENIDTPEQESDQYTIFYLTNGSTSSSTPCNYIVGSAKYYVTGSTTSLFAGDTLYTDSDLTTPLNGNSLWYGASLYPDQSPTYTIQIDGSGVILDKVFCSTSGDGQINPGEL